MTSDTWIHAGPQPETGTLMSHTAALFLFTSQLPEFHETQPGNAPSLKSLSHESAAVLSSPPLDGRGIIATAFQINSETWFCYFCR
jgi:hypothetical protein